MISIGILASAARTADTAAQTSLRKYIAGDVPPGLFLWQLQGQIEILKANSQKPEAICMK